MEQALINTVIAFKMMEYSYSLKCFFKDEFKKNGGYMVPFSHVLYIKRTIFPLIRNACDYVCPYKEQCDGHKFLNFIEKLWEFEYYAVTEKNVFFENFIFMIFVLKPIKFMRWKKLLVGTLMRLLQKTCLTFRIRKGYII